MEHEPQNSSIILIVGERRDRAPIGLAGLLAGCSQEDAVNASQAAIDLEDEDRAWVAQFGLYCRERGTRCLWLRRMTDGAIAVRYRLDGPALTFKGRGDLEGTSFDQDAIRGIWYRGVPALPTFASDDEQAFGERETEAFWEGFGHHVRVPVLNRPRTAGMRPAMWENDLVRHLVADQLGLKVPRHGVVEPHFASPDRTASRIFQTLSTHRILEPDQAVGNETCAWVDVPPRGRIAVVAFHLGPDVVLTARALGVATLLAPSALTDEMAQSLRDATHAIGDLLGESFGAALWDVDPLRGCFEFRDYTTNPDGQTLTALGPYLFPSLWRFLTCNGGGS